MRSQSPQPHSARWFAPPTWKSRSQRSGHSEGATWRRQGDGNQVGNLTLPRGNDTGKKFQSPKIMCTPPAEFPFSPWMDHKKERSAEHSQNSTLVVASFRGALRRREPRQQMGHRIMTIKRKPNAHQNKSIWSGRVTTTKKAHVTTNECHHHAEYKLRGRGREKQGIAPPL